MPDAPASCFVRVIDQRVCELSGSLLDPSMALPLDLGVVSVQPVLDRLTGTADGRAPALVIEIMRSSQVREASLAALAPPA